MRAELHAPARPGMKIRLLRVSPAVHERFVRIPRESGRVHSVFATALNVIWTDGRLLALHEAGVLRAPFAAAVAHMPERILAGAPVERDGARVVLGGIELVGDDAEMPRSRMPAAETIPPWLGGLTVRGAAPALDTPRARHGQGLLRQAIRGDDRGAFLQGTDALIGLGEGLTPAGDDCLLGALAALFRFAPAWISGGQIAASVTETAEHGTTAIAREFLRYALQGDFSEPVLEVLTASSAAALGAAVDALLRFGATSGKDTLAGMALAIESLQARTDEEDGA